MYYTTIESPVDDLLLVSDGEALCGLYMAAQKHGPQSRDGWRRDDKRFAEAKQQLRAYFAGELTRFDLPLAFSGTEFQQKVWEGLRRIPFGQTWSYKTLAEHIGAPKAVRAVGLANGRNPIGIIVPCHRVVGSDGSLTGYGGGLPRKQWLLRHEGVQGVLFGT